MRVIGSILGGIVSKLGGFLVDAGKTASSTDENQKRTGWVAILMAVVGATVPDETREPLRALLMVFVQALGG